MNRHTPSGLRLHVAFFGRRNVGKSSLLNALARQGVSIVSAQAGTTTDPVEKPMELRPLGPVLFIDTAGLDDEGALGDLRAARTRQVFDRTDVAVVVVGERGLGAHEAELLAELKARGTPVVVVFNKADLEAPDPRALARLAEEGLTALAVSAATGAGLDALREALAAAVPGEAAPPAILRDLVGPGETCVLVTPIDEAAPKGRLILPQVQALRDLLDGDAVCVVVKPAGLRAALAGLAAPPRLVVTDSQAFREVDAAVPPEVALTSFSILFSRFKGDLATQSAGAAALDRVRPGDRVLIAEACTHHPTGEDIGRVKLPALLERHVGGALRFEHAQGSDFPRDLSENALVVHCGACTRNRREVLSRLARCGEAGVPVTNYGLAIAHALGILERALGPFPAALEAFRAARAAGGPARAPGATGRPC